MLEKLPFELLSQCMDYLDLHEKSKCLYVCKAWNKKVLEFAYESVEAFSPEKCIELYAFFDNNKKYAKLVNHLFLLECGLPVSLYLNLPSLFPNIKTFLMRESDNSGHKVSHREEAEAKTQFLKWKNTIVDVTETGTTICINALLNENVCLYLKSLKFYFSLPEVEMFDSVPIIKNLKCCTPNLTHLKLLFDYDCFRTSRKLDFQTMEEILNNTPNLKVLVLVDPTFTGPTRSSDFGKVKAHPRLKTLVILEGSFVDARNLWITYFSSKLLHLNNLCITELGMYPHEEFHVEINRQLAEWLSKLSKLQYYCMPAFILNETIVEAMDTSGMQLKRIDLGPYYAIGKCYKNLLNSNQKNSLETITSTGASYQCILNQFEDFTDRLTEFKKLKHLTIFLHSLFIPDNNLPAHVSSFSTEIPLDKLIKNVPMMDCKLKELVLFNCEINAINRFEDTEDGHKKSLEYLQETVLPNTRFHVEDKDPEEIRNREETFISVLCSYNAHLCIDTVLY